MAATENTFGRKVKTGVDILVGLAVLVAVVFVALPYIKVPTIKDGVIVLATAAPSGAGASRIIIDRPAVNVEATSAAYNATEQARVLPQPQQNVNTTGDSAPVVRESIQVERQPANAGVVPISEPIAPTPEGGSSFGSKPAPAVNIQAAHTCLHGQIWTDSGCHNPTPVQ